MATNRICSIPDCGKKHVCRGFCASHYDRFRRNGDPLAGRTPKGYAIKYVHSTILKETGSECFPWPFAKTSGYGMMNVDGKNIHAHRYVCIMAHGDPPTDKHEAAHECGNGNRGCVNPNHLSWKTSKENQQDRLRHGTATRGINNPRAKLSEGQVLEIFSLRGTESQSETAGRFGVGQTTVSSIQRGRLWGFVTGASS